MHAYSYKHFLTSRQSLRLSPLQKLALVVFGALVITFGIISTLLYQEYPKETPVRTKKAYLENTIIQFDSTKSTIDELIKSFQVAGSRIDFFKPQQESQTKDAYYVANNDLERMIAQIKLAQVNLKTAEKSRYTNTVPFEFKDLDIEIKNHHSQLFVYLDELLRTYQIAKDIAMALGPDLYFPTLTSEGLWKKQDKKEITSYYQQKLDNADGALAELARISPPAQFENYYKNEIAYLEVLVDLAKNVNNTLSLQDETGAETVTQIEKAYALTVNADRDMQDLKQKIQKERSNLFDTQKNLNNLAQVKITQNSIGSELEYFASQYAQVKIIILPKISDSPKAVLDDLF